MKPAVLTKRVVITGKLSIMNAPPRSNRQRVNRARVQNLRTQNAEPRTISIAETVDLFTIAMSIAVDRRAR